MTLTDTLDHLLSVFLRPLRTWIEREVVAPLRAAYDAAMQTKEQYRDVVYLHLRERLEGTDEHPLAEGVPVRPLPEVQDLEHLQETIEKLDGQRIVDGTDFPDNLNGVSLVRLLCDSSLASQVTEIIDTNSYVCSKQFAGFPDLKKLTIGATSGTVGFVNGLSQLEELEFPNLDGDFVYIINGQNKVKHLHLPNVKVCRNQTAGGGGYTPIQYTEIEELIFGITSMTGDYHTKVITNCQTLKRLILPNFILPNYGSILENCPNIEEIQIPQSNHISRIGYDGNHLSNLPYLRKFVAGGFAQFYYSGESTETQYGSFLNCPSLIHLELSKICSENTNVMKWSPTMSLRTDTTASDYIDLREDKDEQGEFINATNLEQFLANFRKYIILRVANRTGQTALTLTLSAAVYQNIYGLDSSNNADNSSWARTHTLADLGLTADDLTEAETAAGITINTIYATWLDTYRSAINWNIGH